MVSCANNVGVCALMGGDPAFAVDLIESTLKRSMYCYTSLVLIRNLNILYSLLYSPRTATLKKQVIIEAAKKFGIDLPAKEASIWKCRGLFIAWKDKDKLKLYIYITTLWKRIKKVCAQHNKRNTRMIQKTYFRFWFLHFWWRAYIFYKK